MATAVYFLMMISLLGASSTLVAVSIRHHWREARRKKIEDLAAATSVVAENPQA